MTEVDVVEGPTKTFTLEEMESQGERHQEKWLVHKTVQ